MTEKQKNKLLNRKNLTTLTLFFLLVAIYNFAYIVFAAGSKQWIPSDAGVVINNAVGPPVSSNDESKTQIVKSDSAQTPYYIAYWQQYQWNDETYNICAQKYNAQGDEQWGTASSCPINVYKGGAEIERMPRGVSDGDGGIIIVWSDSRNEAGDDVNDIFGVRLDSNGTVGSGWTANGSQLVATADSDIVYDAVSDETGSTGSPGGVVIAYSRDKTIAATNNDYPYTIRINGNSSLHSGWSSGGASAVGTETPDTNNIDTGFLHIIAVNDGADTDTDKDYIVAFRAQFSPFTLKGFVSKIDSTDGNIRWGEIADNSASHGTINQLIHDNAGGAYLGVFDGDLNIYISHIDQAGTADANFPLLIDNQTQGPPQFRLSPDGNGGLVIVFPKDNQIHAARINSNGTFNTGWPGSEYATDIISDSTEASKKTYPAIFPTATNDYIVLWQDDRDGNINLHTQTVDNTDGSRGFVSDVKITDSLENDKNNPEVDPAEILDDQVTNGSIAMTNNNEFLIVWDIPKDSDNYLQIFDGTNGNIDLGTTGKLISGTASQSYHQRPQVIKTTDGNYISVWEDGRNGADSDIYAQKINTLGVVQWIINGVGIVTETEYQPADQKIAIVPSSDNGAIIAWTDYRDGDFTQDLFIQKINGDGTLEWTADGIRIDDNAYNAYLLADNSGGAYLTWDTDGNDSMDIMVTHLDTGGTVDGSWNTAGVGTFRPLAVAETANNEEEAQMVFDSSGNILINYKKTIDTSGLYAAKISSTGLVSWSQQTVVNSIYDEFNHQSIATSDNGLITTFIVNTAGDYNIKAQKINTNGIPQWTSDGIVICDAPNTQYNPRLVSDNTTPNSGAIITWDDYREGTYQDIYAQRVNTYGVEQWTPNGLAISDTTDNMGQANPEITSNGGFGAIIAFESYEGFGDRVDIRAQHIISTGEIKWSAGGEYVEDNTTNRYDIDPAIAGDQNGGAVIVWARTLSAEGPPDIFAQYMKDTEGGICSEIGSQSFCGQQEIRNEILTFTGVPDSFTFDEIEAGSAPVIRVYNNALTGPDTEDVIRIYDNRNSGGFTVSVDFKTEFTDDALKGCAGGANCIPYEDLFIATSLNELDPNNGNPAQGEEPGVTYVPTNATPPTSIPSSVRNVAAPTYVDTDLKDLDDATSYTTNLGSPVTLMDGGLPAGQGRDGEMWLYANFHLAVGADQAAGNYGTILTYTLSDDTI